MQEAVAAAKELIDANPSLEVMELVGRITVETPAVLFVSDQRIRSFGGVIAVDLTVETDPGMTVEEAYRVAVSLEDRIRSQVENVIEARGVFDPLLHTWCFCRQHSCALCRGGECGSICYAIGFGHPNGNG